MPNNYVVTQLAAEIVSISTKLSEMYADPTLHGGHADQDVDGAGTARNTQWRESLQRERRRLIAELNELGYSLDESGNPVSNTFEIITEATT